MIIDVKKSYYTEAEGTCTIFYINKNTVYLDRYIYRYLNIQDCFSMSKSMRGNTLALPEWVIWTTVGEEG